MKHLRFAIILFTLWGMAQAQSSNKRVERTPMPELKDFGCILQKERGPSSLSSIVARPLPHDSRLVVFPYDRNALYPVNTLFNRFTHFEFEQGERILASYINDETEWEQRVGATGRDIFVKPRVRGATGSMTTITDRRRYQIELLDISGCSQESRYQRVSWQVTDGSFEDREAIGRLQPGLPSPVKDLPLPGQEPPMATKTPREDAMSVNLSGLNTEYTIEGDTELSPVMVMDDGKRTWIKFRQDQPLRPALFAVTPAGDAETVEYVPQGAYFVAPRVFTHGILLKLGKREVKIRNRSSKCGFFDSDCRNLSNIGNVSGGQ
jgi:type IV secretion system protein TrbG